MKSFIFSIALFFSFSFAFGQDIADDLEAWVPESYEVTVSQDGIKYDISGGKVILTNTGLSTRQLVVSAIRNSDGQTVSRVFNLAPNQSTNPITALAVKVKGQPMVYTSESQQDSERRFDREEK